MEPKPNFPVFSQLPSAKTVLGAIKHAYWDNFLPETVRNFVQALFTGRVRLIRLKLPRLKTLLDTYNRELVLLVLCGTVIYIGHRFYKVVRLTNTKRATTSDVDHNPDETPELDATTTTMAKTETNALIESQEMQHKELLSLILKGSFGRTDLLKEITQSRLMASSKRGPPLKEKMPKQ